MSSDAAPETAATTAYLKQTFLTGLAITVPAIVTLFVLLFAFNFVSGLLRPATSALRAAFGVGQGLSEGVFQLLAASVLAVVIFLIGLTADSQYGGGVARRIEAFLTSIPAIGSIYRNVDEISDLLLESDTESFKEVKLIEYPDEGSYSLAFLTANTPDVIREATGHGEMVTLYMPMAPNPVMGGFVVHVSDERVYDVDLTVEEGIQSIVSSGVAVDAAADPAGDSLSEAGDTARGELI